VLGGYPSLKDLLGQRRAVIGQLGLLAHQDDAARVSLGTQSPGGTDASDG
jgi:hypothetical protein